LFGDDAGVVVVSVGTAGWPLLMLLGCCNSLWDQPLLPAGWCMGGAFPPVMAG